MKSLTSMTRKSTRIFSELFFVLITVALFSACKKDSKDDSPSDLDVISWPQKWVFVSDYDESTYTYIYSSGSLSLYRGNVEKSYSVNDLIDEKDCQFEVNPAGYGGLDKLYTIRSAQNIDNWWGVYRTYTPFGEEQWFLGTNEEDELPDGDECRFLLHKMPDEDGKKVYAIESYLRRGEYLDNVGHNFTGNGLSFIAYDKPENAPGFKVLLPSGYGIGK